MAQLRNSQDGDRAPVFIVGCGKSGTTLLRLMLNAHSELAIPLESHFIYQLARRRARGLYREGLQDHGVWQLMLEYFNGHRYLHNLGVSVPDVIERLRVLPNRSYGALFETLLTTFMEAQSKHRWGDKTPMYVNYMFLVRNFFPQARFVHIIRDGRDVALSLMTSKWGPRHMNHAGHYWKWLVLGGMIGGRLMGTEHYRQIRYEDLVCDPESVLKPLCDWLDMGFELGMLEYHKTAEAQNAVRDLGHSPSTRQPIDRNLMQNWKNEMSQGDHASFIRQAGSLLCYLGYDVPNLSGRQQKDLARINNVLALEPTKIEAAKVHRRKSEFAARSSLRATRLVQLWYYLNGDYKNWAAAGIYWQQTVASLMR
jgi:hypothetical protein